ncbi:MAG: phosphoenolpyruvate carboxylase, partial [Gemmatimonadetes bacterium]|nr:phosphoenolpyruvate carboxylase [Gemmatimonadota bacterium]
MPSSPDLRRVDFSPKDEPLRQDVRLLGDLVGSVIREQGGEDLFQCVEAARHWAIRRREGVEGAAGDLGNVLSGLDADEAAEVIRAFSTYFQVVNLAERVHRIRRGRQYMRDGREPHEGSLAHTVHRLIAEDVPPGRILELFQSSRVEPVFTAHPTESTRRVILDKQERIAQELIHRLDPTRTPHDERVSWSVIRENVTTAWQTEEHPSARPTVADEREHVLYYVTEVLYRILPALHEQLEVALKQAGVGELGASSPLVRPGSWVGGDMDGNPNVDAKTFRQTLQRHRALALHAYQAEISQLADHLTQSASRVRWSEAVSTRTEEYSVWFPEVVHGIPDRMAGMGYRVFLQLVGARLEATRADGDHAYTTPTELAGDIELVVESLRENGGEHAGLFGVTRLLRRIRAFGFHMAALDVRQDARELRDVVADLLGDPEWPTRTPTERTERLHGLLANVASGNGARGTHTSGVMEPSERSGTSKRAARTLDVFAAIREARQRYGPDAIGSYIISMAQDVDDVLTVLWLAVRGGLGSADDMPLDVTPLFET